MTRTPPTLSARERRVVSRADPSPDSVRSAGPAPRALRVHRGDRPAVELSLDETERYVLGRHNAADLGFASPEVSRLHAVLRADAGVWLLEDYGSRNGTTVLRAGGGASMDLKAHTPVRVFVGDVVELGSDDARLELMPALPRRTERADSTELSPAAQEFRQRVVVASRTQVPVFLHGPSGCGKTHMAREIHNLSSASGPFVPINCARLPREPSALHSELLGHVRGAFTGAGGDREGKLLHARGGTLFLDEVEGLDSLAQGFLLDVLEGSGDIAPLGGARPIVQSLVFRLISASKAPLGQSALRLDLCERLAEGHMWGVPTLRERRQDIPGLMRRFADEQSKMLGVVVEVPEATLQMAARAPWPGQIRQLKAAVRVLAQTQVALAAAAGQTPRRVVLEPESLQQTLAERANAFGDVDSDATAATPSQRTDARKLGPRQIQRALRAAGGNKSEAARALGVARNTLARKLREFELE